MVKVTEMETVSSESIAVLTSNGHANSAVHTSPLGNGSMGSSDGSLGLSPSDASTSTSNGDKRQKEPDPDAIKMFVGQVPRSYDEAALRAMFEEFGPVYQLNVLRDKATLASRGCCFVTFFSRADAIKSQATLHNVKVLPGMHHPIQMKPADSENRNERKLFVGMLSKKYNEAEVRAMFAGFGHIEDCSVLRDPNANSKGCAFVTFASRPCAAASIKAMHHSQTMEGCSQPLVVKFADTQKEKEQKKTGAVVPSLTSPNMPAPAAVNGALAVNPINNQLALLQQAAALGMQPNAGMLGVNPVQQQLGYDGSMGALLQMSLLLAQQQQSQYAALPQQQPANPLAGLLGGYQQQQPQSQIQQQILLHQQLAAHHQQQQFIGAPVTSSPNHISSSPGGEQQAFLLQLLQSLSKPQASTDSQDAVAQQQQLLLEQEQTAQGFELEYPALSTSTWQPFGLPPNHHLLHTPVPQPTILTPVSEHCSLESRLGAQIGGKGLSYPGLGQLSFGGLGSLSPATTLQLMPQATQGGGKQMEGPDGANLFIYHLPQEFTDQDLAQTFLPFGNVVSAKVFIDKQTNLSKCFGFVSYDTAVAAAAAISAMNGFAIGTKRLKVQLKRSKSEGKPYAHPSPIPSLLPQQ